MNLKLQMYSNVFLHQGFGYTFQTS